MAYNYFLTAIAAAFCIIGTSCSREKLEAEKPVYLSISDISIVTDSLEGEGTSDQKITTVWIMANGKPAGTFELPCTIPVILKEGQNDMTLYPGIHLNGISASRAIYDGFKQIDFQLQYAPSGGSDADTIVISKENRTTTYQDFITVKVIDDFEDGKTDFVPTDRSDTIMEITEDPNEIFINIHDPSEKNMVSGVLYTTAERDLAEVASFKTYTLPQGNANVYLEMHYKSNIPLMVGIIAVTPTQQAQKATLGIYPNEEWNKIYVNLVTEVSSSASGAKFKIFFSAEHKQGIDTGRVFLDNLKLVY